MGCSTEDQKMRPLESEVNGIHTEWMSQPLQVVWTLCHPPSSHIKELKDALEKSPGMSGLIRWVLSHNKRLVLGLHGIRKRGGHKVRNYIVFPTLTKDRDALLLLARAVHLERTVQTTADSS